MLNNKWIRGGLPAILIHCSIGSVYVWSLFVDSISKYLNTNQQSIQFAFSLAIFFLGMSAAFGGKFVEKNIRISSLMSTICFCSGLILTGLAIYIKALWLIYIAYGCLMGIGLGIGYITPIKTLMLWFDEQKGLATGIAIMGFGFASTIASPLINWLKSFLELPFVFIALGFIYFIPMIVAHLLIKKPNHHVENEVRINFNYKNIIKDKQFVLIWGMIFLNISCGLALISIASPMLTEMKCKSEIIALVVSIMGLCNGFGRLFFSALSDKLKDRINIYMLIFISSILSVILSIVLQNPIGIIIILFVISATYGAGFSNLPTLLSDRYGLKNISTIHGLSLSAWAIAGLCGNQISSIVKNITGQYINVLYVIVGLYIIGTILTIIIKTKYKQI